MANVKYSSIDVSRTDDMRLALETRSDYWKYTTQHEQMFITRFNPAFYEDVEEFQDELVDFFDNYDIRLIFAE